MNEFRHMILACLLAMAGPLVGANFLQNQSVFRAYTDTNVVAVGGSFELVVERKLSEDLTFQWDSIPGFILLNTSEREENGVIKSSFRLMSTDTGHFDLPLLQAYSPEGQYETFPGSVDVVLLTEAEGAELADVRPNAHVPFKLSWWFQEFWPYLLAGLAALGVGLGLWWAYKRRRPKRIGNLNPPVIDPFEQALKDLDAIRREKPWEQDPKEYYVRLGNLVRIYLSHASGIPLSETTTEEALALVHQKWTGNQIDRYHYIMTRADVVKFAKGQLDVADHLDCLQKSEELILEFKPRTDHA